MTVPAVATSLRDEEAAPEQRHRDGREEGELDGREPPHAQLQRVELGVVAVVQGVVHAASAAAPQAEGVDGAGTVGRLGDDAVEHGIRRALAQVAVGSVAQVAPRRQHEDRHADDDRQRDLPAGEEGGDDGDRRRDGADEDRRDAEADDVREGLDVVRRARDEVAGAGALDGRQGQLDDPTHELLAQLGEDRLAHDERGPAGEPRDDRLHDDGTRDPQREPVDDVERPPVADLVDEQADDAGGHERRAGGDGVQADDHAAGCRGAGGAARGCGP